MVAAIVLVALGGKTTLAHVGDPLPAATALVGGTALYLLAHVAFKVRTLGIVSVQRLGAAAVLLACLPLARRVDAGVTLAIVATVSWVLLAYEAVHYAESRRAVRHAGHDHE